MLILSQNLKKNKETAMTIGNVINSMFEQESSQEKTTLRKIKEMIVNGAEIIEFQTHTQSGRVTRIIYGGKTYICEHDIPMRIMVFPNSISYDARTFHRKSYIKAGQ